MRGVDRLDPLQRQHYRRVSGTGPFRTFLRRYRSQGGSTKTGNTHARRLLVEAAWNHRRPYNNVSRDMRARWDAADEASRVRAATKAITGCTASGSSSKPATNAGSSPTSPSRANSQARAGPSPQRSNRNSHGRMTRRVPFPALPDGPTTWRRRAHISLTAPTRRSRRVSPPETGPLNEHKASGPRQPSVDRSPLPS